MKWFLIFFLLGTGLPVVGEQGNTSLHSAASEQTDLPLPDPNRDCFPYCMEQLGETLSEKDSPSFEVKNPVGLSENHARSQEITQLCSFFESSSQILDKLSDLFDLHSICKNLPPGQLSECQLLEETLTENETSVLDELMGFLRHYQREVNLRREKLLSLRETYTPEQKEKELSNQEGVQACFSQLESDFKSLPSTIPNMISFMGQWITKCIKDSIQNYEHLLCHIDEP